MSRRRYKKDSSVSPSIRAALRSLTSSKATIQILFSLLNQPSVPEVISSKRHLSSVDWRLAKTKAILGHTITKFFSDCTIYICEKTHLNFSAADMEKIQIWDPSRHIGSYFREFSFIVLG
jgi:hypothetical protein